MSSSSSEDDYDVTHLKEAIATDFITDAVYQNHEKLGNKSPPKTELKSLRPTQEEDEDQFNELGVSKGFRQHVAKHLVAMLDKSLKTRLSAENSPEVKKRKRKGGVRLLSNSEKYIKVASKTEENGTTNPVPKRLVITKEDSEEEETKVRSVAVEPEYILSGREILHWSKRSKAQMFRYKQNAIGQLQLSE